MKYVDESIEEATLGRKNQNNNSNNISAINLSHITINSEPIIDNHVKIEAYVDSLTENDRSRRDLSLVMNDQDKDLTNSKLTDLDSVTLKWNPLLDNEVVLKIYVDETSGGKTILRFNATLER